MEWLLALLGACAPVVYTKWWHWLILLIFLVLSSIGWYLLIDWWVNKGGMFKWI